MSLVLDRYGIAGHILAALLTEERWKLAIQKRKN
jgi:hypothetical protein